MDCSTPGFPALRHLPELAQTHAHWSVKPSNHLILRLPLLLLPSIVPWSRVFSNESSLGIRWSEDWSISMSSSNEYSGLISFRIDRLNLLAVQGTLKSLLQYHISKASILQSSAFFMVQLSHPYMTTGIAMKSESESEVTQSCLILCDPMDYSLPSSSVHGIFQAIVLKWIAISFSRGSNWPRDWTQVSRIVDRRFTVWATREVLE